METTVEKLPIELSNKILSSELQIDTEHLSQDLISSTIQLYVEAISFYNSIIAQNVNLEGFNTEQYTKRSKFYQQKIKRLLVREDIQHFLVGKSSPQSAVNFQKQLAVVSQHAPEQARALTNHYQAHLKQQNKMIENSLISQKTDLNARIERRSRSKRRSGSTLCEKEFSTPPPVKRSIIFNY